MHETIQKFQIRLLLTLREYKSKFDALGAKSDLEHLEAFATEYSYALLQCVDSFQANILLKSYLIGQVKAAPAEQPEKVYSMPSLAAAPVLPAKAKPATKLPKPAAIAPATMIEQAKKLYSERKSYATIGKLLGVSDKTAKKYVES